MAWPPVTHQDVEDAVDALQPAVAALQSDVAGLQPGVADLQDSVDILLAAPFRATSRLGGPIIGWCGDSITAGSGASNVVYGFRNVVPEVAGGLVASYASINGGVSGDHSGMLLARMDGIIASGAQTLFVMIGTNDVGNSLSMATTQSNIEAIKTKADQAGLPIAFGTIPPRGTGATGAQLDATNARNLWLKSWCASQGVPLADTWAALVDRTTGLLAAAYDSGDHVHPNDAGHAQLALTIAPVIEELVEPPVWPVQSASVGLLSDPLQALTAGATYADDMWVLTAGAPDIYDVVAASGGDLPAGQWTRVGYTNSSAFATMAATIDPTKWGAGDKLAFFLYVRGDRVGSVNKVQVFNQGNTALTVALDSPPVATLGPVAFSYTVPSTGTPTALKLAVTMKGTAGSPSWMDVGACDVFNLTRYGIDLPL